LQQNGVSIIPEIEVGSMEFLIEFAKIGIGSAFVIKEFVLNEIKNNLLFEIPIIPQPQPREIGIITKGQHPVSKASQRFIQYLTEAY
jgi:DNA-binding transcriptional LysR family regulator